MSFGCRWVGELKPQVEAFLVSAIADPPTHRFATVVYDFPAVLDDLFNVGNRCAHEGAALLCGSPMHGELVVSPRPENHWPPLCSSGGSRTLALSVGGAWHFDAADNEQSMKGTVGS